jgi:molybdopterin-binding protein
MEISARNQLRGTVKSVTVDGLMAEVVLDIGGQEIASTITRSSAERLGLKKGDTAVAIIKATEVLIAK